MSGREGARGRLRTPADPLESSSIGQHPAEHRLEVIHLDQRRLHGMVGALMALLHDGERAVEMAAALLEQLAQAVAPEVIRARRRYRHAVLRQHLHGLLVEALIGGEPGRLVFLRLMKAGGSRSTTSNRSRCSRRARSVSKASPARVVTAARTPFKSALRSSWASAGAELSTHSTSVAPATAACTPQPPI